MKTETTYMRQGTLWMCILAVPLKGCTMGRGKTQTDALKAAEVKLATKH